MRLIRGEIRRLRLLTEYPVHASGPVLKLQSLLQSIGYDVPASNKFATKDDVRSINGLPLWG